MLLSWLLLVLLASRQTNVVLQKSLPRAKSADTAAQQHAADAAASEQGALVAAAEESTIATRQTKVVLHLRMTRQISTKMRATTTIMTQLTETTMVTLIKCRLFGHKMVLCK